MATLKKAYAFFTIEIQVYVKITVTLKIIFVVLRKEQVLVLILLEKAVIISLFALRYVSTQLFLGFFFPTFCQVSSQFKTNSLSK
jgi:hypothetical protein